MKREMYAFSPLRETSVHMYRNGAEDEAAASDEHEDVEPAVGDQRYRRAGAALGAAALLLGLAALARFSTAAAPESSTLAKQAKEFQMPSMLDAPQPRTPDEECKAYGGNLHPDGQMCCASLCGEQCTESTKYCGKSHKNTSRVMSCCAEAKGLLVCSASKHAPCLMFAITKEINVFSGIVGVNTKNVHTFAGSMGTRTAFQYALAAALGIQPEWVSVTGIGASGGAGLLTIVGYEITAPSSYPLTVQKIKDTQSLMLPLLRSALADNSVEATVSAVEIQAAQVEKKPMPKTTTTQAVAKTTTGNRAKASASSTSAPVATTKAAAAERTIVSGRTATFVASTTAASTTATSASLTKSPAVSTVATVAPTTTTMAPSTRKSTTVAPSTTTVAPSTTTVAPSTTKSTLWLTTTAKVPATLVGMEAARYWH